MGLLGLLLLGQTIACSGSMTGRSPDDGNPDKPNIPDDVDPDIIAQPDDAPDVVSPTPRVARLSHAQWDNSVRRLLSLEQLPVTSKMFTGDPSFGQFDNNGGVLQVSEGLWVDYQKAAEEIARVVSVETTRLNALAPADGTPDAFIRGFGRRAFRRPLTDDEASTYQKQYDAAPALYGLTDKRIAGVRLVLETMLQSPNFIYRIELSETEQDGKIALDAYEVASRLSFALTNNMPSDALFAAADAGDLDSAGGVASEAGRLIASDDGRNMVRDMHAQLLRMQKYDFIVKDKKIFPTFDPLMNQDFREETLRYVDSVMFDDNGNLHDLLRNTYTFANDRTAPLYGLDKPGSLTLQRVELNADERRGLLTQIGFLASNAKEGEVDSIHRGVFVHRQILCTELPDPPGVVPPLPAGGGNTNRKRITTFTGKGTCGAGCHSALINPIGFAFENFDALGQYRETEAGEPIDAKDAYAFDDGDPLAFDGALELTDHIADSRSAHDCYTKHWLEYLHGRVPNENDAVLVERLSSRSQKKTLALSDIAVGLVASDAFRMRLP
jgi:Protein of unknown function (DUF1592)/Protein of unknown function (DUF1588)/Protein of unknown function (DUF1595)/Protein of unknown function (DUF1587)/Protein of unknown function (DUF1585)